MDLQSVKAHLESLTVSDAKRFISDLETFVVELEERGKQEAALAIKKCAEEAGLTVAELIKFLGGDVAKKSKKEGGKRTSTTFDFLYKGKQYIFNRSGRESAEVAEICKLLNLEDKKALVSLLSSNKHKELGITDLKITTN